MGVVKQMQLAELDAEQPATNCRECGAPIEQEMLDCEVVLCFQCLVDKAEPEADEPQPAVPARNVSLRCPEGMSEAAAAAMHLLRPTLQGALTVDAWQGKLFKPLGLDINTLADELTKQVDAVIQSDDMGRCEAVLVVQAHTLDVVANNLLGRAARAEYLSQLETYTKLGLKAQAQCRATIEALAAVRSPPSSVLKQTNIANGPQQVNTAINEKTHDELSTVGSCPPVETVDTFNRPENESRESSRQSE
jgi:hypothetical protein